MDHMDDGFYWYQTRADGKLTVIQVVDDRAYVIGTQDSEHVSDLYGNIGPRITSGFPAVESADIAPAL